MYVIKSASDLLRLFSGIYGSEHFVQAFFCLCVVLLINKCFWKNYVFAAEIWDGLCQNPLCDCSSYMKGYFKESLHIGI